MKNVEGVKNKDTSFGSQNSTSLVSISVFFFFSDLGPCPLTPSQPVRTGFCFRQWDPLWWSTCTPNTTHTLDLGSKWEKTAGFTSWLKMLFLGRNPFWHDGESPQIPSHGQLVCSWNASQNKGLVVCPHWIPATSSEFTSLDFPLLSTERHTWLWSFGGGFGGVN